MKDILRLIKKYKYRLFVILFFSFLSSSLSVMFPKFISETIDSFQKSQFSLTNSLTILVAILIAAVIFSLFQNILSALLSEKISLDLRTEIVEKIGTFGYLDVNKITPCRCSKECFNSSFRRSICFYSHYHRGSNTTNKHKSKDWSYCSWYFVSFIFLF